MPLFALALAVALRIVNVATLVVASLDDVKHRIIPDATTLIVLVAGVSLRLLSNAAALWTSTLAAAAVYVALAALVHANVIGGSDAKLGAAVTFLVPAPEVLALFIDIALAGGVLSILYIAARRLSLTDAATLPYGVAIFGGSTFRMMADQLCSCSGAISFWR